MAITQIGADTASRTSAGPSLTPTGRAFQIGDLIVIALGTTLNETTTFTTFNDLATQTVPLTTDSRGVVLVGSIDHSGATQRTLIYACVADAASASIAWRFGYNANSHGGCQMCIYRSDETFDAWDGTNHVAVSGDALAATSITLSNLVPASATGLMFNAAQWTSNDTSITNPSPWTQTRSPLNVATSPRCVLHCQYSDRSNTTPVAPSVTGISSATITGCAVWIPTGAAGGTVFEESFDVTAGNSVSFVKSVLIPRSITAGNSVSMARSVAKTTPITAGSAVSVAKQARLSVLVEAGSAATMTAAKVILQTISATAGSAATVTKRAGKIVAASAGSGVTMVRGVGKNVAASAGSAVAMSRLASIGVLASAATSVVFAKLVGLTVSIGAVAGAVFAALKNGLIPTTAGARIDTRMSTTNHTAGGEVAAYTIATRISTEAAVSDQTTPGYRIDTRIR